MLNTPFSPWPSFTEEEADAARSVILSNQVNYWTGTQCRQFEEEFAAWSCCSHAIAVANGTVALELALRGLGIGVGDEVIVTPRTFIASVSCIVNVGATPVFADIDPDSQNITAETIRQVVTSRTRAIICVHLAGWPCDMDPIMALANELGIKVIEDCAQAHGARYQGRPVGSIGHIGSWSFCQDKIMTTAGEGGMVTTNDATLWSTMWSHKEHGKSWDAVSSRRSSAGFRWVHESFGTNWRMTELQAAIGRIQLKRMEQWHASRKKNALRILGCAKEQGCFRVPLPPKDVEHAFYKAYVFIDSKHSDVSLIRDRMLSDFTALGVPCFQGSCSEVYLEKAFEQVAWKPVARLPVARLLGETALMFLVHPTLTDAEIALTCYAIRSVANSVMA